MLRVLPALLALLALASGAPAQNWAKAKIEKSPRHGEWVKLKVGAREVQAYVVFPEVKEKATAVLVIHEIFGLTDWVRLLTDELAEAGYIAIAPDLLSGLGPKAGGSAELGSDGARKVIGELPPAQITADLSAAADYALKLPSCNGKLAVCGFCYGGGQAFRYATNNPSLKAAFVFYGSSPKPEELAAIRCPVHGFYAENDNRIIASIPATTDAMKKAGKTYEPVTYTGGGHGFMRAGDDPAGTPGNKTAREEAWKRWKALLGKL